MRRRLNRTRRSRRQAVRATMGSLPRALSCWWAAQVCIWVPSRRTSAAAFCRFGPGTATGKDAADRSRSRLRKRQRTGALQDLAESARRMRNREASLECGGKRWRHAAFGGRSSPAIRRRIRRLWRRFFNLPCRQVALGWASTSPTCSQFRSAGGSPTRDTASLRYGCPPLPIALFLRVAPGTAATSPVGSPTALFSCFPDL